MSKDQRDEFREGMGELFEQAAENPMGCVLVMVRVAFVVAVAIGLVGGLVLLSTWLLAGAP